MGYRSQVGLAIAKEKYLEYKVILQKPLKALSYADSKYSSEIAHYFYWSDIKRYDNYEDISEINELMDELDTLPADGDYNPYYAFIEIGQDSNDITERGEPFEFEMELERAIAFPTKQPFTG